MPVPSSDVLPPAVAGTFYPAEPAELAATVRDLLGDGDIFDAVPKAVIAPHAGYIYSGPTAASVYAQIAPHRENISRVVMFGPAHRARVAGIAATSAHGLETPLGIVPLDRDAIDTALGFRQVRVMDAAFAGEHCLEVQLPFLQQVLGEFSLAPFLVGEADGGQVAEVLEALWGGPETLVVISSDLSHYHGYEAAQRMDSATTAAIETLDPDAIGEQDACGRQPIKGLLHMARALDMRATTLDLRNSGDTAGGRDKVVGYGAWMFEDRPALPKSARRTLLAAAREAMSGTLENGTAPAISSALFPWPLRARRASFVTLMANRELRGCVGTAEPCRALVEDVAHNARAAAFHDRRFPALTAAEELDALTISVSVLGVRRPLPFETDEDLLEKLVPGRDGLVIGNGGRRGLFLPQVWDSLPDPRDFLAHLKAKAELGAGALPAGTTAHRFSAESFGEDDSF